MKTAACLAAAVVWLATIVSGATPCRDSRSTATLLENRIVPHWNTLTADALTELWPGLTRGALETIVRDIDGGVVCEEHFAFRERGGLRSFWMTFSGSRTEVLDAAQQLSKSIGRAFTFDDLGDLENNGRVVWEQPLPHVRLATTFELIDGALTVTIYSVD